MFLGSALHNKKKKKKAKMLFYIYEKECVY